MLATLRGGADADRVGENYFAAHSEAHRWYYFPRMLRDEAVLIKCWDSRGEAFAGMLEASRGYDWPPAPEGGGGGGGGPALVPATFSLHTGFELPEGGAPADAPERESIEVRLVAFFEEGPER